MQIFQKGQKSSTLCILKKFRKNKHHGDLKQAIDAAVNTCIDEELITDFLQKHSKEITGMLLQEIAQLSDCIEKIALYNSSIFM